MRSVREAVAVGALSFIAACIFSCISSCMAGRSGSVQSPPMLRDIQGAAHRDEHALRVLLFTGIECGNSNSHLGRIAALAGKFPSARFYFVNSNYNEPVERIAAHAREHAITLPIVKDEGYALAARYGVESVPTAVVIGAAGQILYRGRIDDDMREEFVQSRDLQTALEQIASGRPVTTPETPVLGCYIKRVHEPTAKDVTYVGNVAPILAAKCVSCHHTGGPAPFVLDDYEQARGWAAMIKAVTGEHRMPPWKPVTNQGLYLNERRLTDDEIHTLARWADAGAPRGTGEAPRPAPKSDGWLLGAPDTVLDVGESFPIEATGPDTYRCFVLKTSFPRDRWVGAVEFRPGNPGVVHHVISYLDTRGEAEKRDLRSPGPGYACDGSGAGFPVAGSLGGWAAGNMPRVLPEGVAYRLPKGAAILLEVHYHKTGKPELDRSSMGLHFAQGKVHKRVRGLALGDLNMEIPAGASHHEVRGTKVLERDIHVLGVTPHMHNLGREVYLSATPPGRAAIDLVSIRDWDFYWQETYQFKQPIALSKGSVFSFLFVYDNSSGNPRNPHRPPQLTRWGEQATDEMGAGFVSFTEDAEDLDAEDSPNASNALNAPREGAATARGPAAR